ncbi:MAG TPA: hypothetical protein VGF59_01105, partial [Bryobacteraceae bacterium]
MRLWTAVLLLSTAAAAATPPSLAEYAPPGTEMIFGIRMSSINTALSSQGVSQELHAKIADVLASTPLAGFDPLRDLDEVLLAGAAEGEKPPSIGVLIGRFDIDRFAKDAPRYHGVPIIESKKAPDGMLALVDASTAIVGTPALVRAAIDGRGQGGHISAALMARAETLHAKYDIWGAANPPAKAARAGAQPDPFDSVDRFDFGAALRHGVEAAAEIHVRSRQDADKMASTLRLFEAMMKAQQPSANGAKFDMQVQNGTLKVALNIPPAALKKAMTTQRAAIQQAFLKQMPPALA